MDKLPYLFFAEHCSRSAYSRHTWSFRALSGLKGLVIKAELGPTRPNLLHIQILDPLERWPDTVKSHEASSTTQFRDALYLDPISETDQTFKLSYQGSQFFRQLCCFLFPLMRLKQRSFCRSPKLLTKAPQRCLQVAISSGRDARATIPIRLRHGRKIQVRWTGHIPGRVFTMMREVHWCALMCTIYMSIEDFRWNPTEPLRSNWNWTTIRLSNSIWFIIIGPYQTTMSDHLEFWSWSGSKNVEKVLNCWKHLDITIHDPLVQWIPPDLRHCSTLPTPRRGTLQIRRNDLGPTNKKRIDNYLEITLYLYRNTQIQNKTKNYQHTSYWVLQRKNTSKGQIKTSTFRKQLLSPI